jgi:hypothetical protein
MKQFNIYFLTGVAATLILTGCSDDSVVSTGAADGSRKEIRLQAEIDQTNVTRANDNGFTGGDRIGIYAVNFKPDGNPGTLLSDGNLADNVNFTFDEENYKWTGDRNLYFADDKTPVDFYGYYPQIDEIADVNAYPFSVERNQSAESSQKGMSAYEASDFLWAKTAGITASTPLVTMTFKHILASVQVTLLEGRGFAEGEWTKFDKSVIISNTNRKALINLATGESKPIGEKDNSDIIANPYKDNYRAIVIPQTVDAGKSLITITVDGQTYNFVKNSAMTFMPSKMHKFTIEVSKTTPSGDFEFSLIDESITAWESDMTSHNGQAKEYIVINIPEGKNLNDIISEMKLNPAEIINLKIVGGIRSEDFKYIRSNLKNLEALNMSETYSIYKSKLINIPDNAFVAMYNLHNVILSEKTKTIGGFAFYGTGLTGSLEIPEGVEEIGYMAFSNQNEGEGFSGLEGVQVNFHNNLTGKLSLPSTLKKIGERAFSFCDFTGQLLLPNGLTQIGAEAFANCKHFSGELHLPENLLSIGSDAFGNMEGIIGNITIPSKISSITGFSGMNVNGIIWPDNPIVIKEGAFVNLKCKGDIKIPESVEILERQCFRGALIKHLLLPSQIISIPNDMCSECSNLSDTLSIPDKVEMIDDGAFLRCGKLEAVILPSKLTRIGENTFGHCYNLTYIHCKAIEPPTIAANTFIGVEKDNFTVEVPEQSVEAYRNAPGWREFKRITAYRNFVARPSKYNVLNKGGKKEIILNADAEWEMIECPSWCHIDKSSGSQKALINLTVDQMSHGETDRFGKITFRLKGAQGYLTHINIGQYDYEYDEDQYLTLQTATKGNGVNLAFIGDGYDAADIASGGYLEDMKQEMEYLFAVEPYATYREYFNIYTAIPLSEDSGIESINSWRNTKFQVSTGDGCSKSGQRLFANWEEALDYCTENIPPTVSGTNPHVGCVLVANTEIYEGKTYLTGSDTFCAVVTKSTLDYPSDARGLVQHEAGGHGIGWLADEYIYHLAFIQKCGCQCCKHVRELLSQQATGFGLNLSLNGKYKETPWTHLIFNPKYGDIVDIYEGGYFHSRGVYRSEYNSCMNNNVPYFSTWSRQLIVQRIMKIAGEKFDLDSFYAKDSRAVGRDFTTTSRAGATNITTPSRHGNAPVRITNYKYGKKGVKR